MTDVISREAARDFLHLTVRSYDSGMIGKTVLLERLVVLVSLGRRTDRAVALAREVLDDTGWISEGNGWSNDISDGGAPPRSKTTRSEGSSDEEQDGPDPDDRVLYLVASVGGQDWMFHPYDDDPFPSVPHGHARPRKSARKLDPYQGWVYDRTRQLARVARQDIIALWNDEKFRATARISINYYLEHHPHHVFKNVRNPRKLPRRRKPRHRAGRP